MAAVLTSLPSSEHKTTQSGSAGSTEWICDPNLEEKSYKVLIFKFFFFFNSL